jgi:hypothetical protein
VWQIKVRHIHVCKGYFCGCITESPLIYTKRAEKQTSTKKQLDVGNQDTHTHTTYSVSTRSKKGAMIEHTHWNKKLLFNLNPVVTLSHQIQAKLIHLEITYQTTNQPNQPTNQPINQSTNQPINQSTNQPINQSNNQSANQPTFRAGATVLLLVLPFAKGPGS